MLKKGYATVWDQCSQEVRDKLEASGDCDCIHREQSLHNLITKIKQICVGFDDHKQEIFNLVQALKILLLYTQGEKESVDEYACNFKSLWDTVEAFGGSPRMQKGLIQGVLDTPGRVANPASISADERASAEGEVAEAVKAAMLISGVSKARYARLKEQFANNYLLCTDQYPNTLEKATRILGNYQGVKPTPFEEQRSKGGGLAFIQGTRGGQGHGTTGKGTGSAAGCGSGTQAVKAADSGGGGSDGASTASLSTRTNSVGESHCYNCSKE